MRKLLLYYMQNVLLTLIVLELTQYTLFNAFTYFTGFVLLNGVFLKFFEYERFVQNQVRYNIIAKKWKYYARFQLIAYLLAGLLLLTQQYVIYVVLAAFPFIVVNLHSAAREFKDVKTQTGLLDIEYLKQSAIENLVYKIGVFAIIVILVV